MYTFKNSLFPVWIHLFPFLTYIMPHWNTLKDITNIIVIRKDCVTYFEIKTFLCILITEGFYFLHLLILPNQFAKKLNKLFLLFSTYNEKKKLIEEGVKETKNPNISKWWPSSPIELCIPLSKMEVTGVW